MRFTLRQLELFVAACETESVSLAAQRVHLSQSAASSAISQLERQVQLQLLVRRHAHGVTPTPAGRLFLQHARAVLRDALDLDRLADAIADEVSGTLDIGCLVTLAPVILPRLCYSFSERFPAVRFRMHDTGQEALLRGIRDGDLSLALTYDLGLDEGVAFERLAALPPHALLAANHPFARRRTVDLEALAHEPFVMLDLPLSREYFHALFIARGLQPNIAQRSAHPELIRSLVANGYGYSLVNARPAMDLALDGGRVVTVPLAGEHRSMQLGIATLAGLRETRLIAAFHEHCVAAISDRLIPGMIASG